MGEYTIHIPYKDLELYVYPEISRNELDDDFYKLKELCGNGIDFVHRDDIIELQTIIVEPTFISLYFRSLRGFLLNKKPSTISTSWRLLHFNEAIQDKEILPLIYIDPDRIDSSTIAKLLLLIS